MGLYLWQIYIKISLLEDTAGYFKKYAVSYASFNTSQFCNH